MEIGIEYYYVREVVKLIIAQRLARKLCPHCKEPYRTSARELEEMRVPNTDEVTLSAHRGCEFCRGMGYIDRTGVFEIMPVSDEIKEIMTPEVRLNNVSDLAVQQGMLTLCQNAVSKVMAGETSLEEIRRTVPR